MRIIFLSLFLLLFIPVIAQDFDDYQHIKSTGAIPAKFTTSSTEKYRLEAKTKISAEDKRSVQKTKDQFFLESNFAIDEILLSGKVMFNDPVSVYVNKVVDELLKNEPELRKEVEVYVIKSGSVNAFTTNNGLIFVCLGLLAQLENEAQLAYILAHEVVHYKKQHSLDEFIEVSNIERGAGDYRYQSYDDRLLAKSNYSKEKETESDIEGLKMYLKTNYDLETVDGVFDVLQYSYLPFDEVPFRKNFLETKNLIFPDSYFLKETKAIEPVEENDELSTHPAVSVRRAKVKELIDDNSKKGRKKYIVGKKEFEIAQKISRYEMVSAYLQDREYENALYSAYLLLQENPNSKFLKKEVLKALYGLSKYASASRFHEVHSEFENVQGSIQQVYHLFEKMEGSGISVTALTYAWNLKKQYPNDNEIKAITDDLFATMVLKYFPQKDLFSKKAPSEKEKQEINDSLSDKNNSAEETEEDKEEKAKKNKYAKIKAQSGSAKQNDEPVAKQNFTKYAFVDELKTDEFNKEFDKWVEAREAVEKEEKRKETRKYRREQEQIAEENRNSGYALGLDKVIFVSPFYYKVNALKSSVQRVDSESAQKNMRERIIENASLAGLNYEMIDKKNLRAGDVETFNDLAFLNDYIDVTLEHEDLNFIHHQKDELLRIGKKYNTRYFCWTGIVSVKEVGIIQNISNCWMIIVYPFAPYFVYKTLRPNYRTVMYTLVLDTETGKSILNEVDNHKFKDRNDLINSTLYDFCLQLKTKRK